MASKKEEIKRLSEAEVEVIKPKENTGYRKTKFTDDSFTDKSLMVYEKSNTFALSYSGITNNEQALLLAGLVAAYNVNKQNPFTEAEKEHGIRCYVPIVHVARMMGYDTNSKSFYRAIKQAAVRLSESKPIIKENEEKTSFSIFHVINQIDYNLNNDGMVAFSFSPGASDLFLNNKSNFTLYSLILSNKVARIGKSSAVTLHEVLKTDYYKAEKSDTGKYNVYYDYIDFKCKLFLVNTNNDTVRSILENPRYAPAKILRSDALAYERAEAIEHLDDATKKSIKEIRESDEYKRCMEYKKTQEYKKCMSIINKSKESTPEYEEAYQKVREVISLEHKLQILNDSIICQYNDFRNFRRIILTPAQKAFITAIRDTDLMDMMFEYKPYSYKGKVIGINFTIYTTEAYKRKEEEQGVQMSLFDYLGDDKESSMISPEIFDELGGAKKTPPDPMAKKKKKNVDINENIDRLEKYVDSLPEPKIKFSAAELYSIAAQGTFEAIKEKYDMMPKDGSVANPLGWMVSAIKNDYKTPEATNKKNKFNEFEQRADYNFDEIEKNLLAN